MIDTILREFTHPFSTLPWQVALARMAAALVLGGVIGLEREARHKPAGLRTHMLVSLAACLVTVVAFDMLTLRDRYQDVLQVDPLRLIEAVTAGVAFLAAGTIISTRGRVSGVTTGAGLWLAGAIGLTCGVGNMPLAAMATLLALVVLALLRLIVGRGNAPERE